MHVEMVRSGRDRSVLEDDLVGRDTLDVAEPNDVRYSTELLANEIGHPRTVYVREDSILPPLDRWLARIFDPDRIDATCEQLAAASDADETAAAELEANRRRLRDCDRRLAKYRAALESGADPAVVAAWITEVQAERAVAERSLAQLRPQQPVSAASLREIVEELVDIPAVLADADPELRARVYGDLGITLTYRPAEDLVAVAAVPSRVRNCVSEGGLEQTRRPSALVRVSPRNRCFMRDTRRATERS